MVGLQLPGELRSLLDILGYTWPEADETAMFDMGNAWIRFSVTLADVVTETNAAASAVWVSNTGKDIAAFRAWWNEPEHPADSLRDGVAAAVLTGTGMMICGAIVLALKIAVIVQLVLLAIEIAQAISTAAVTFGGSLAEIPVFQQLTRAIVGNLIQEAIWKLIDG